MLYMIEDRTGSYMISNPLMNACFKVAWNVLHGSIDSFMSLARSLSILFFYRV